MSGPGGDRRLRHFRVRGRVLDAARAVRGHCQDLRRGQPGRRAEGRQHPGGRLRHVVRHFGIQV